MARLFTRIFSRTGRVSEPQPDAPPEQQARAVPPVQPPPPLPEAAPPATIPAPASAPPAVAAAERPPPPASPPAAAPRQAPPLLTTRRWGPANRRAPESIVFLCHGMNGSANGIIQIAPQLGTLLETTLFIAPNGPEVAISGSDSRLWFDARDRSPVMLEAGVREAAAALDALINAELERAGLDRDAYALVGYSQGAMTALFTGLRRRPPPRAILSYAGALIAPGTLDEEMTGPVPVMLVHGLEDPVVPAFYSRDAEKALRALRIPVQTMYVPRLGHAIDAAVVQAGKQFLARWLAPQAVPSRAARSADG